MNDRPYYDDELNALVGKTVKCTAWDLIGRLSDMVGVTHYAQTMRGVNVDPYTVRGYQRVKLHILKPVRGGLYSSVRYVDPDYPVMLIPVQEIEGDGEIVEFKP